MVAAKDFVTSSVFFRVVVQALESSLGQTAFFTMLLVFPYVNFCTCPTCILKCMKTICWRSCMDCGGNAKRWIFWSVASCNSPTTSWLECESSIKSWEHAGPQCLRKIIPAPEIIYPGTFLECLCSVIWKEHQEWQSFVLRAIVLPLTKHIGALKHATMP